MREKMGLVENNVFVKARFGLGKGMMRYSKEVVVESDGYLGELRGGRVELTVNVLNPNIYGFTIQPGRDKVVVPKADENEKRGLDLERLVGVKRYILNVAVKESEQGKSYVQYPSNSLGLLWIKSGSVEYWRIAVVEQNGKFFLVDEKVYESDFSFGADGKLHALNPKIEQWPSMTDYIGHYIGQYIGRIGSTIATRVRVAPYQESLILDHTKNYPDGRGVVAWFSKAEGTGAIATNKGMARFHWSEIVTEDRFASIDKCVVEYEKLSVPTDARSKFKYEAFGVKAL